ncbi:MAG TPA: S8 family serine peptidase [Burkholderiaceae bacterium]|nr:S8 family serine peptidase [Burkholderiaceae bacterium]
MTWRDAWRRAALGLALGLASLAAVAGDDAASAPAVAASAPRELLVMLRAPTAHARIDGSYGGAGYGDAARAQSQARVGARLAAAHGFAVVTLWALPALGMDCVVLALPPGADVGASIAALQAHPEVAWAQAMNEFHAQGHADPLYKLQPAAAQWHLDDLHAVATGRRVRVAIIDSGIDDSHPDLAQAVLARANFVDGRGWAAEAHGTAVAGLVAARADNGIGIVGIAPDAQLYALRACWEASATQTLCNSLSLARALSFAIERRAEVINLSLSGPTDLLLGRLIDVALAQRQQVVAAVDARAAGGGFPAGHPGVIAVADAQAELPSGIAGAWAAPARDLPATAPGGGWRMVTGSSFAAGEVSGLLAVMAQARSRSDFRAPVPRLVRLAGGGIDACASLLAAVQPAAAQPGAAPGCRALLAVAGGPSGAASP